MPGRTVVIAATLAGVVASGLTLVDPPAASAAISPTGWNTVAAKHSGKCLDTRAAGTANGTVVQQYACNSSTAQQWQFQPTSGGYVRINVRTNPAQVVDVSNVSTADGRAGPPVGLRRRQQPAVAAGRGGGRRLPLREPEQRQVPRRTVGLDRGQRPVAAVHLQRQRRPVVQDHLIGYSAGPRCAGPRPERRRSSTRRCRPVDDPDPARPGLPAAGDRTSSASSGTRCCSSRAPTTSTSTSASTPRSLGSASPRTT